MLNLWSSCLWSWVLELQVCTTRSGSCCIVNRIPRDLCILGKHSINWDTAQTSSLCGFLKPTVGCFDLSLSYDSVVKIWFGSVSAHRVFPHAWLPGGPCGQCADANLGQHWGSKAESPKVDGGRGWWMIEWELDYKKVTQDWDHQSVLGQMLLSLRELEGWISAKNSRTNCGYLPCKGESTEMGKIRTEAPRLDSEE